MVTLLILDGWGLNDKLEGNAIKLQGTPNLDKLNKYPYATLDAAGEEVGLTPNQMGNSEVGHLNLGAGRIVYQDLPKINKEIKEGSFFENPALKQTMQHVVKNGSNLHLMGLLSDGGVHAHINHLKALIDMAEKYGVKNVYIHAFTDGRDTLVDAGIGYVNEIEEYAKGRAKIATIMGRVQIMDRENRWDRIERSYNVLVRGIAPSCESAVEALKQSYNKGVFDEFVEPVVIDKNGKISENDGVIFYNYRTDRAREITEAITQTGFDKFNVEKFNNLCYCCMTEYSSDFTGVLVAYPPEKVTNNLSKLISDKGLKQFHVAETTKYAHVTFFFNGGIEKEYKNETRKLIDSINVKDFSEYPQMRAKEITEEAVKAIESKNYDFVLINISNPDMIGHTGKIDACKQAVKVCDECAYKIAMATLNVGGDCIITADHGNIEELIDDEGNVQTAHTTNLVPVWLVSEKHKNVKLNNGALCNVAPTVLKLMGIEIPNFMEKPLF